MSVLCAQCALGVGSWQQRHLSRVQGSLQVKLQLVLRGFCSLDSSLFHAVCGERGRCLWKEGGVLVPGISGGCCLHTAHRTSWPGGWQSSASSAVGSLWCEDGGQGGVVV